MPIEYKNHNSTSAVRLCDFVQTDSPDSGKASGALATKHGYCI